jgi:hypothetical protein
MYDIKEILSGNFHKHDQQCLFPCTSMVACIRIHTVKFRKRYIKRSVLCITRVPVCLQANKRVKE